MKNIDSQLDQLLVTKVQGSPENETAESLDGTHDASLRTDSKTHHLQTLIKSLSAVAPSSPIPSKRRHVQHTLRTFTQIISTSSSASSYDSELEWFLLAKITNRVYGHVLQALIDQTLPLNDELWYYLEIINSQRSTALYSLQTSPLRFWAWSKDVYAEVRTRGADLSEGWQQFYGHVKSVVKQRSLADVRRRAAAPMALIQDEVRQKIAALERAKRINASAVGYLLSSGFNDDRYAFELYLHHVSHIMKALAPQQPSSVYYIGLIEYLFR